MLFSDNAILRLVRNGEIEIKPELRRQHLRPAGVRVHLSSEILVPAPGQLVDLLEPRDLDFGKHDLATRPYVLEPGCFILASTLERIKTGARIGCFLEGRSTIARIGLSIHNTASFLDGTHQTWLTPVLEITNHGNFRVVLRSGLPIGMLCFHQLSDAVSLETHNQQYAHQDGTTPPNLVDGAEIADNWHVTDSP